MWLRPRFSRSSRNSGGHARFEFSPTERFSFFGTVSRETFSPRTDLFIGRLDYNPFICGFLRKQFFNFDIRFERLVFFFSYRLFVSFRPHPPLVVATRLCNFLMYSVMYSRVATVFVSHSSRYSTSLSPVARTELLERSWLRLAL